MPQDESGYHTDYSAFGGHPLDKVVDASAAQALARFGITDAEQLLASAAVPEVQPYLQEEMDRISFDLPELIRTLQAALPAQSVAAFEHSRPVLQALGAIEPTPEIAAEIEAVSTPMSADAMLEAVALPQSVNHSKNMSPIRQQGSRGTCVAHALTAMHEHHRRMSGASQDFSEQFLYHQIKLADGAPSVCGTWQVRAVPVLANVGQARESVWAYNPNPPCNGNGVQPAHALADAANYRIQPIVLGPRDVGAIKAALAGGSCVGFSIAVYNSWYQSAYTTQTGRINMRVGNEPSAGGHAMCFIGYQDDPASPGGGFFILRNSWGQNWGAQCPYGAGNGTIPYAYIANEGWEAVTLPPPRKRYIEPRPIPDWRRRWPFGSDQSSGESRGTITIDTNGMFDILIR